MAALRAVFFGSPAFAVPSLRAVAADTTLVAVVSQPDRPAGRGQEPSPPAVKVAAAALGVPVIQPEKVRTPETEAALAAFDADIFVVVAYGRILPQRLLDLPRLGPLQRPRVAAAEAARRRADPVVADPGRRARPASRSCAWRRASTPGRWRRCARCRSRTTTRRGRCPSKLAALGAGCWPRRCRRSRTGRVALAPQDRCARDAGAAADEGGRPPDLRSAGARRLGARARRRSVAGRERAAGRRAPEAVRAARRRRRARERRPGRGAGPAARGAGGRLRGGRDRVRRAADAGAAAPARGGRARRAPHPCGHGPRVSPRKGRRPRAEAARRASAPPVAQARGGADGARRSRAPCSSASEVGGAYANRALSAALDRAPALSRRGPRRSRRSWSTACCAGAAGSTARCTALATQRSRQAGRRAR